MVSLFKITLSLAVIFVCVLLTADILRFIAIFFPKKSGKWEGGGETVVETEGEKGRGVGKVNRG